VWWCEGVRWVDGWVGSVSGFVFILILTKAVRGNNN
jgi:hypothetical protein